jgi:putative MATE family efflux protein
VSESTSHTIDPVDPEDPSSGSATAELSYRRGGELPVVSVWTVLWLAMPAIVEQSVNAFIGLTDTWIAGHIKGDDATVAASSAAVGAMTYLQWFGGLMAAALAVGATAIVARSIGARRYRLANRVAGTAFSASFLVGLVVSALMLIFAEPIVHFVGLQNRAAVYGVQYLRIMVITMSFQTASQIGMACLRGAGDMLRPMLIVTGVMVINFFASAAFTFGWFGMPAWGVQGNAFGTLLAYAAGGIGTSVILLGGWSKLNLRRSHLKIVPHMLKRVLRIGVPSWLEGVLLWGGQFFIVKAVINAGDPNGITLAAHNVVLRIESISFLPGFGFGMAASTLVGQYLGAKRPDEARHAARIATRLAFITMTVLALPMIFIPRALLQAVVESPSVVGTGYWPLILAGLAQPAFAIAIIMGSALKGAGDTFWPMVSTITGIFVVRVPLVFIIWWAFKKHGHADWGLIAVWICIVIDLAYRGAFNTWIFMRGAWMTRKV